MHVYHTYHAWIPIGVLHEKYLGKFSMNVHPASFLTSYYDTIFKRNNSKYILSDAVRQQMTADLVNKFEEHFISAPVPMRVRTRTLRSWLDALVEKFCTPCTAESETILPRPRALRKRCAPTRIRVGRVASSKRPARAATHYPPQPDQHPCMYVCMYVCMYLQH